MEVTRNVILDLLPLYLADEASQDTRVLIENYLESDPELAHMVERSSILEVAEDIPIPISKEDQMEAYREAKKWMFWRTIIVATLITFGVLALLAFAAMVWLFLTPA